MVKCELMILLKAKGLIHVSNNFFIQKKKSQEGKFRKRKFDIYNFKAVKLVLNLCNI